MQQLTYHIILTTLLLFPIQSAAAESAMVPLLSYLLLEESGAVPVTPSASASNNKIIFKTGQTKSYAPYDDGYYQKGLPHQFSNKGNHVEDAATQLMWQDTHEQDLVEYTPRQQSPKPDNQVTQAGAVSYCLNATTGGYSDWRLPTVYELRTISNFGRYGNAYYRTYFHHSSGITVLTSSIFTHWRGNDDYADMFWGVYGCDGHNVHYTRASASSGGYVRCVRGEETAVKPKVYTRSSDGIVTDNRSKLQWQDKYDGHYDANGIYINDASNALKWSEAVAYCHTLSLGSHNDWRLPNYNEMFTLIDNPADKKHWEMFQEGKRGVEIYWSSTSHGRWPDTQAWGYSHYLNHFSRALKDDNESHKRSARCVRDGN